MDKEPDDLYETWKRAAEDYCLHLLEDSSRDGWRTRKIKLENRMMRAMSAYRKASQLSGRAGRPIPRWALEQIADPDPEAMDRGADVTLHTINPNTCGIHTEELMVTTRWLAKYALDLLDRLDGAR